MNITVTAYTRAIGPFTAKGEHFSINDINSSAIYMPDLETSAKAESYLKECMQNKDSAGGVVECVVAGLPAGI